MELDAKAARFTQVKWNKEHTSFIAVCPGSNGKPHNIACGPKTSCLGHPRCSDELIGKFFANGTAKVTEVRGSAESPRSPAKNGVPPDLSVNGNGKVQRGVSETDRAHNPVSASSTLVPATDLTSWKLKLYNLGKQIFEQADNPSLLASSARDQLIETTVTDFRNAISAKIPAICPLPEQSETDRDEDLYNIAGAAVDAFQKQYQLPAEQKTDLPQLPDLFAGELQIMTGRQLLERHAASRNQTVIEGFLSLKEISIWSGKVEAGKTTLLRTAAMCVARGEPFLERSTVKGRVLYVMLDADGIDLTTQEFLRLGYNADRDLIDWLIDPILAMRQDGFSKFYAALLRIQPMLVIIDPFGRFQEIKDFNAYDATYAMARISELAKQANCHIALPHHIPRGRNDDADAGTAGLGSISIGGGTNARFVCTHKPGDIYTIKTSKGKGASFVPLAEEFTLNRDPDSGWITLGQPYSWKAQAVALKPQVLQVVERSEEPMSASQIAKELGLFKSACGLAANMLWEDGQIDRDGTGKRGKKYQYSAKKRELKEASQYEFNS